MAENEWWLENLNPRGLSQGDVLDGILIGSPHAPITFVGLNTRNVGGVTHYPTTPKLAKFKTDESGLFIARGGLAHALVISHDCEVEKPDNERVLIAPMRLLSTVVSEKHRANIMGLGNRSYMPLPGVPELGDCYADLRCIGFYNFKKIEINRAASMSVDAVVRLQQQLIAYFTRYDTLSLTGQLTDAVKKNR